MPLPTLSRRFAILYVLSMFGAFIAFVPLSALILPQKIAAMADIAERGGPVRALSWLLITGGVMAGIGNIVAGHIGDWLLRWHGDRRPLVVIGLALTMTTLIALGIAQSFAGLVLAMAAFQLALNLLLSPLAILLVDYVPDQRKGSMAGWLGLALPVGSLAVTALVSLRMVGPVGQVTLTALAVFVLVAPLAILWPVPVHINDHAPPEGAANPAPALPPATPPALIRNFALAWLARLLVQFAAAAILPFLYFYVADIALAGARPDAVAGGLAILSLAFAVASVGGAMSAGWLSDRIGRRQPFLVATAAMVAIGMVALATTTSWPLIVAAYAVFAAGLGGFLAVDSALVAQLISSSDRRATLLGVMNLTNTIPGIVAPLVTLLAVGVVADGTVLVLVLKLGTVAAVAAALCGSQIQTPPRAQSTDAGHRQSDRKPE